MNNKLINKIKRLIIKAVLSAIIRGAIILSLMVIILFSFIHKYNTQKMRASYELITYTEYLELLDSGSIDTVTCSESDQYMYISLHNDLTRNMSVEEREKYEPAITECRKVYYPGGDGFAEDLLKKDVLVIKEKPAFGDTSSLVKGLFCLCIIGVWFVLFKRLLPVKGTAVIESKFGDIDVGFEDIIGHEEVKKDLKLLVKQMRSNDDRVKKLTHGILFEGMPGTGKTMLAKAVAKEAGYSFISVNASSLIELYVGVGAKRVREVFDKARKKAPCIVFFDEIDSIGKKRGSRRSNSEDDQTINALLAEMDGFESRKDIVVIAATNRAADLDPALVRAGRFDRTISIQVPDRWETRKDLFDHYLLDNKLDENVDTESLAKQTNGYSGADIAAVCREANMIMYSKDKEVLSKDDIEEAIDKIIFKGNRISNERQDTMEVVAYHEAGHAIMTLLCNKPVARISIMGMTSGIGGVVFQRDDGCGFHTKREIEQQIRILYAGRASEEIKFGRDSITDGASNDITEATKQIVNYHTKYCFDNELIDYYVLDEEGIINSDVTKRMVEMSAKSYEETKKMLMEHFSSVELLAKKLLETKMLSGAEIEEMNLV